MNMDTSEGASNIIANVKKVQVSPDQEGTRG